MFHVGYILAVSLSLSLFANDTQGLSSQVQGQPSPSCLVASHPSDPGRDITDDPHGPDPHGPDPRDEIHDSGLPANADNHVNDLPSKNLDRYLPDKDKKR
jgi:hypothetical protein